MLILQNTKITASEVYLLNYCNTICHTEQGQEQRQLNTTNKYETRSSSGKGEIETSSYYLLHCSTYLEE